MYNCAQDNCDFGNYSGGGQDGNSMFGTNEAPLHVFNPQINTKDDEQSSTVFCRCDPRIGGANAVQQIRILPMRMSNANQLENLPKLSLLLKTSM